MKLHIYVAGAPKGQPRGRHVPAGKGKFRVVSTADPKITAYRTRLIAVMKEEAKSQGWETPKLVEVNILAFFYTKDSFKWGHYCGKKPDRDNIDKLILDCAGAKNGAGLFKDDACVAAGSVTKLWSRLGGLQIELTSLDGVWPQQDDDDDLGAQEPEQEVVYEHRKYGATVTQQADGSWQIEGPGYMPSDR
jgi:Holliday junction resolvase RusA-like endonuclease